MAKREEILQGLYDKGYYYEKEYQGCAQCTIAAVQDFFDLDDLVLKRQLQLQGYPENNYGPFLSYHEPQQRSLFEEAGGHDDKCLSVVGQTVAMIEEILLDNGIPVR